jgi:hypothetical protein
VVAEIFGQVADQGTDRVDSDAPAPVVGIDEEIDPRVAVRRLELLTQLDQPNDGPLAEDAEASGVEIVGEREVILERTPPRRDLGPDPHRAKRRGVTGRDGAQDDAVAAQLDRLVAHDSVRRPDFA